MITRILIADDDAAQLRCLEASIMCMGYRTLLADSGTSALSFIQGRKDISLVLLDLAMPDLDGYALLERMAQANIGTPVIALVPNEDMQMAMRAIKLGAVDFVTKPVARERLQISVANAFKLDALTMEVKRKRFSFKTHLQLADLVIKSPEMEKIAVLARRAVSLDAPLLIEGEVGTGKETLARAIYSSGERSEEPFLVVDCSSIIPEDSDEVLFGTSSAFPRRCDSGSGNDRCVGKLFAAGAGTVYLNEISYLPLAVQRKLFHFVQGNTGFNARIMAASNVPLLNLVHSGRFHAGLCHWLSSFLIRMPPLRDRTEDIPILAQRFMLHFASEERCGHITGISPFALELLKNYGWPDNVRELKNAIYQAVLLCEDNVLCARDFRCSTIGASIALNQANNADFGVEDGSAKPLGNIYRGAVSGIDAEGQVRSLALIEEDIIRLAIDHYEGQISEVARRLGIGRTTLYRKIKEYGIDVTNYGGRGGCEIEMLPNDKIDCPDNKKQLKSLFLK